MKLSGPEPGVYLESRLDTYRRVTIPAATHNGCEVPLHAVPAIVSFCGASTEYV